MDDLMWIGKYQLRNLISNNIGFVFIDLREDRTDTHALLVGSIPAKDMAQVRDIIEKSGSPKDGPIVLICEQGRKSSQVANELLGENFINVFPVEGGVKGLLD